MKFVVAVGLLAVIEAVLRLVFYYESAYAGVALIQPMPPAPVMNDANVISLTLGLGGLVATAGLLLMKEWGFWGTAMVSAFTIVFDGVSALTVSYTAFAGLVLPAVFLLVLIPRRTAFFEGLHRL